MSVHFLLHFPNYSNERSTFLNTLGNIDRNILTKGDSQVTSALLYGEKQPPEVFCKKGVLNTCVGVSFS